MKHPSPAQSLSISRLKQPEHGRHALRLLATTLTLALLTAGSVPASAEGFPGTAGIPTVPDCQAAFEQWLSSTGKPLTSRYHGYVANYTAWRDYHLLVYGSPSQVSGNRYDRPSGQYASLGFSYDEIIVTNSLFPDDAPGGITQTTPWQWTELNMGQSSRISWARLDDRQKSLIKNATLTYRNNSYGGMTFAQLNLRETTTVVLAPPSWYMGFALYTQHLLPGSKNEIRYATFNGAGGGDAQVGCTIELLNSPDASGCFVIDSLSDSIDIQYRISGSLLALSGLAAESDISSRGAGNEQDWVSGSGAGPWISEQVLHVTRQDLQGLTPRQWVLNGAAWVVSQMGDIRISRVEKVITVRAEEKAPAFAGTVRAEGKISYFSGQVNSQGQAVPGNPHRFLALERVKIIMDFTRPPIDLSWTFNGLTQHVACQPGKLHYETDFVIPLIASTLFWDNTRLRAPMSLTVNAREGSIRQECIILTIPDIEITGNVHDITYPQTHQHEVNQ